MCSIENKIVNPFCPRLQAAMSSVLVETSTLVEIHFLADELTRNPSNVTALAKKLKELLLPYNKVSCFISFCKKVTNGSLRLFDARNFYAADLLDGVPRYT